MADKKITQRPQIAEPEVIVELGGQERVLRLDFNALALMEEKLGSDLPSLADVKTLSITKLRTMVWCLMVGVDETITEKQVGSWLTFSTTRALMEKLTAVFSLATYGTLTPPTGEKERPTVPVVE